MTLALRSESLGWDGGAVLRDITLEIAQGSRVAIMGRSGVGKSTLLRALQERAPGRSAIVAQDHGLVDALSVFHNVWLGRLDDFSSARNLRTLIRPSDPERATVERHLTSVGLNGLGRRPVSSLSGGQRQRVALARAMLRGGGTVFADEPVSALDPAQGDALLRALLERFETAVIVVHDLHQALRVATRIVGLKAGRVALDVPAADIDASRLLDLYT